MDSICASFESGDQDVSGTQKRKNSLKAKDFEFASDGEPYKEQSRMGDNRRSSKVQVDLSSSDDAFKKVLRLVGARDRSARQLKDRLKKDGFSEQACQTAVERAVECGLIDDLHFADVLIRSRIAQGKGLAGIERELKDNDIDPNEIPGWPYEYQDTEYSELDRALSLLKRNPPRAKNKRDAAYRKLVTKGFSSSVAASAARQWGEMQR